MNEPEFAKRGAATELSRRRSDHLMGWLRDYAASRINSRLIDERRCVPPYIILDFGNQGLLGMQVSEQYGGLDLSYTDTVRVLQQLAAIDVTLATIVFLNNSNAIRPIQYFATPGVRERHLSLLARGRELGAFALSEPGAGSNLASLACVASPGPHGGWCVRGVKRWNASSWAGIISVFARTRRADGKLSGLTGFAVAQGAPGLQIGPEALTMGLRGSMQNALYLRDVPVQADDLLGEVDHGMVVVEDALLVGRLYTAAVCVGAMKRCFQLMARYAERRSISTGLLVQNPVTRVHLTTLAAAISGTEALTMTLAALLDAGQPVAPELAMIAKIAASEELNRATAHLFQLLGGRGYMENNLVPQLLRDARVLTVGEGPNEALISAVGRSAGLTNTLERFLRQVLGEAALAARWQEATQQIRERCLAKPLPDRSSAQAWADTLIGHVTTQAVLRGALEMQARSHPTGFSVRACEWARLRFEAAVAKANERDAVAAIALSGAEVSAVTTGYTDAIGDVEQSLAGEDQRLDPLLRQSASGMDLPSDLGAEDPTKGGRTADRMIESTGTNLDGGKVPSPAARRELLERLLKDLASE